MRRRRPSTALTATNAARARMHHRFAQLLLLLGARGCSALLVHGSAAAAARRLSRRGLTSDYVEELFDGFAESFEDQLALLEYAAPARVAEAARERSAARGAAYGPCLDAGCGTGLAGHGLRGGNASVVASLDGIDLSPKMAAKAEELCYDDRGVSFPPTRADAAARKATGWQTVYDRVVVGDLLRLDEALPGAAYDLVVSADVLCYFGALDGVLQSLAAKTKPGGDIILTVETLKEGDYNWVLQAIERYAHDAAYVADVATRLGLVPLSATPFRPRFESGTPVEGTLHVLHKPPRRTI